MPSIQSSGSDTNHTKDQVDHGSDDVSSNFDALIDLLASDDIHDIAVAASDPSRSTRRTIHLRDASGKLDFDKIHLMFAKQNVDAGRTDDTAQTHSLPVHCENDFQVALSRTGLSRSVSPSSQSSGQQHHLPSSNYPASPDKNIQNIFTQTLQSLESIPASSESARIRSYDGNDPPSHISLAVVNNMPHNHTPFPYLVSSTEQPAMSPADPTSLLTTSLSSDKCRAQDLTKPLQFEKMNNALSRATSEVDALREKYEKLRTLIAEQLPPSKNLPSRMPSSGNHVIAPSQAQASVAEQGLCSHSNDISCLSEFEAKKLLTRLVTSLRLSPHSIQNLLSEDPDEESDLVSPPPRSVEDIKSSLNFMASVDELVWKRSLSVNGSVPDLLYSKANVDALMQRLALWEKSVRGPQKG